MELRQPKLTVIAGKKGIGKTYKTIQVIRDYVRGNPAMGIHGRPALIIDPNNEYSDKARYPDIQNLSLRDVPKFAFRKYPEIKRIAPFHTDGSRMTLDELVDVLKYVTFNYFDGLLLVEDINKYISDNMPHDIIGGLCTQRHSGVDVILHYQHIARVSTKVWQNLNTMRLHRYSGSIDKYADRFEDIYELIKIAENIVNNRFEAGDERFYLYVDMDKEKIFGEFSDEDYEKAVLDYCYVNYNKAVKHYLNIVNEDGDKLHNPATAIKAAKERLMKIYR